MPHPSDAMLRHDDCLLWRHLVKVPEVGSVAQLESSPGMSLAAVASALSLIVTDCPGFIMLSSKVKNHLLLHSRPANHNSFRLIITHFSPLNKHFCLIQCKPDISRLLGSKQRYRNISESAIYRAAVKSQHVPCSSAIWAIMGVLHV